MAVDQRRNRRALASTGSPSIVLNPQTIRSQRKPTTSDFAEIGTTWIDIPNDDVYVLTSIVANSATWTTSPASGGTTVSDLTVTGAGGITVDQGDVDITLGDLNIPAGNATIGGDLSVNGTLTFTGGLSLSSSSQIGLTSTYNGLAIKLDSNGGIFEQIYLHSEQGLADNSILLQSDVGGLTLSAGSATPNAITLTATAGGLNFDGALQVNIASSQDATDAIVLSSSAGGINLAATGEAGQDIDILNTGGSVVISASEAVADAITLTASDAAGGMKLDAGSNGILVGVSADCAVISLGDVIPTSARTITLAGGILTGVDDTVDICPDGVNDAASTKTVNINNGANTAGAIAVSIASGNVSVGASSTLSLSTGTGIKAVNLGNADANTTFNIDAVTVIADSVNANTSINTGTSTGTVTIGNAAAGAVTIDSAAGISLDGAAASNFSVSGAGIDLTASSAAGRVVVDGGEAALDSVRIVASDAGGGIDVDSGTAGHTIDSTGAISIDAAAASNFSVSGAGIDLTLASAAGRVVFNGEQAAADACRILSAAGGLDANVALQMNLDSSQAAADAIRIISSDVAGGIDVDSGTAGHTIDSTGAISIDAAAASNFSVSGASVDLTLSSAAGSVVINGEEAVSDAIQLTSAAGGITASSTVFDVTVSDSGNQSIALESTNGGIYIAATGASAGLDIDLEATGSSVNITSTEAVSDAIVLSASNAAGGITLDTGGGPVAITSSGNVSMENVSATAASPTASVTTNGRVFKATFTGFTTASAGTQAFTITNSSAATGSGVMVTVANAGSNDAQMTLNRVDVDSAGTLVVHTTNNGAAALNGNVIITGWIID